MSTNDGGAFARLLRQNRQDRGQSHAAFARSFGLNPPFYRAIERGDKYPSLLTFASLHRRLKFDANEVLDHFPDPVSEPAKAQRRLIPSKQPDTTCLYAEFGRRLADARRNAQLTQISLTRAIGGIPRSLIRYERGEKLPSLRKFAQFYKVLGFDANVMLAHLDHSVEPRPFHGFGFIIKQARVSQKRTVADVASESGCDPELYQRIESGHELPTFVVVVHLHRLLDFDANAALSWLWRHGALPTKRTDADPGDSR